jgi:signal transduction histidine kinase
MTIWSRSLTVQFIGLLLLALAASQGVSAIVFWGERGEALQKAAKSEFLSRSASLAKVLESTPKTVQRDILQASGTTYSRFWVTGNAPDDAAAWRREAFDELSQPLPSFASLGNPTHLTAPQADARAASAQATTTAADWRDLPAKAWPLSRPARFQYLDDGARGSIGLGLAVRLADGTWLNTAFAKPSVNAFGTPQSTLSLTITALLLCGIAAFIARGITRPMRQMAVAAEALGRGEQVILPETGPADIRQTAEAFNRMQDRLQRFVADRTRMLAAIGHDLRTPITTLRLRAEFVTDDETREKMLSTIDELRAMAEASLAFAREESVVEPTRAVDLTALVGSLCEDLSDLGQDVTFEEGPRIAHRCRPDAFRRAARNIVENAVRYGGCARVRIVQGPKTVDMVVEDDGPGVPLGSREQVFEPFFRMEGSRNRETGGIGLGLAIARTIVRAHGGDITLANAASGFQVTISVPRTDAEVRRVTARSSQKPVANPHPQAAAIGGS